MRKYNNNNLYNGFNEQNYTNPKQQEKNIKEYNKQYKKMYNTGTIYAKICLWLTLSSLFCFITTVPAFIFGFIAYKQNKYNKLNKVAMVISVIEAIIWVVILSKLNIT